MFNLNNENYYSSEANREYWSVSQFKTFDKCEAAGLAEVLGEYEREETDALLIGSYVDAVLAGSREETERFIERHGSKMFKKNGELLAKFEHANDMIDRAGRDPLITDYLTGDKQTIFSGELFGVPWKIKIDVYNGERIVDLKTVRDFADIFEPGYGWRSWVEYWGYDVQGAIYQRIEQIATGRNKPLPFYLAAVTKEKVPDITVIEIPQHILDAAYRLVEAKIERFDLIKSGDVEPIRCEKCDYCKTTKVLRKPEIYEIREAKE